MDASKEKQNLSKNLKAIRIHQNLSQFQLAERAGININTLIRIEQKIDNPQVDTLCLIAKALNCDLEDLFKKRNSNISTTKNVILDEKTMQKIMANVFEQIPAIIWKEINKL